MTPQSSISTRERLSSPLTWHVVGLGVMIVAVLALAIRLGFDWAATNSNSTGALANKQVELKTLQVQTAPLRGLDQRVLVSRQQIADFYEKRIPTHYSSFSAEVGDLAVKSGVHLSRMQYTQGATTGDLTEISLDAGISGDYAQIMHFVNGIERDKTFFIIRAMNFTGQQGGLVGLRLRVSTFMHPADAPSGLPPTPSEMPADTAPPAKEGE